MKTALYLIEFYTQAGHINFAWVSVELSPKYLVNAATRAREHASF